MSYGNLVLASTKTGLIPSGIKWVTNSQFSHSFVTVPDVLNAPMCIEAAEGGVDYLRFDIGYMQNQNQGCEIWSFDIDQSIKDAAILSILTDLEIGYGFFQFPWFIWRKLNALFGRDIKAQNNWDSSGMICSQLCVAYLKACGLQDIFKGYGNGSIAPQDLQNIFKANPTLFSKTSSVRLSS